MTRGGKIRQLLKYIAMYLVSVLILKDGVKQQTSSWALHTLPFSSFMHCFEAVGIFWVTLLAFVLVPYVSNFLWQSLCLCIALLKQQQQQQQQ